MRKTPTLNIKPKDVVLRTGFLFQTPKNRGDYSKGKIFKLPSITTQEHDVTLRDIMNRAYLNGEVRLDPNNQIFDEDNPLPNFNRMDKIDLADYSLQLTRKLTEQENEKLRIEKELSGITYQTEFDRKVEEEIARRASEQSNVDL